MLDDRERKEVKQSLKYPPVEFTGVQAKTVAEGFAWAAEEIDYQIHACAVLPEHVHLVIGGTYAMCGALLGI